MIVLLLFILLLLLWSNYEGLDTQENTLLQEIKRKTPVSNLSSKKENIHILPDDNRHFPQDSDDNDLMEDYYLLCDIDLLKNDDYNCETEIHKEVVPLSFMSHHIIEGQDDHQQELRENQELEDNLPTRLFPQYAHYEGKQIFGSSKKKKYTSVLLSQKDTEKVTKNALLEIERTKKGERGGDFEWRSPGLKGIHL